MKLERWSAFRRLLPSDVYLWLKALLLALVAIQSARLLWTIVTPVGPLGDWRPASPRPLPLATQTALLATLDPFFRTNALAAASQPAPAVPADIQLYGTRAGASASAIIGKAGGEQKSYVIGEDVAPGVKLVSVLFDRVVLESGGNRSELVMPSMDGSALSQIGGGPTPAAATIAQAFDLKPRQSGTQVTGVIVGPAGNPAIFQAAGFKAGDVILSVNGARISSPIDVQQLQSTLVPGARLTLSIERGGQVVPLAIDIPAAP
jgi:general secretion pathway protein C